MNLSLFNTANLFEAATNLFAKLGITLNSNTKESLPVRDLLKQHFRETEIFKAIEKTFYIGTIDNSLLTATGMYDESYSYKQALQQADKNYEGLMLFALQLSKQPTRTEIAELTRAFNRISQKMPVALLLKYQVQTESVISICISERFKYLQHWRQGEKAGKVIILRDIHTHETHAGHRQILKDLVIPVGVTNYAQLHQHWLQVLDVSILNKKFFQELANWYFWAMDNVQFPDDIEKKKDVRNATNLIRLITRVIFIWFIKEKKLVPANLFRKDFLGKTVKDFAKNKKSDNYYQAILQNLFFGTLNQIIDKREFAESHTGFVKPDQSIRNIYRFQEKFLISESEIKKLFDDVPFLNGGLFDCLDKTDDETKKDFFVDGFTRRKNKQAIVPDYLFFGVEEEVDLNEIYATKNKKYKVKGLVNLLESYKFTVAENTPIEEEIALDPELLGKVFENLLASYNPETQTTARKQTGSFYTPREIVNYMVDESLMEYLKQKCDGFPDLENRLCDLFSYSENPNPFNEDETSILIKAINNCKMLDPACGSGAFPMGMLHKMVHILTKLDSGNILWRELQRQKAIQETEVAYQIDDKGERKKRLDEIDDVFDNNASDYGRKLYLIENCIYGIDIQPIAVQIAKLRFFISLIIDQNKQEDKENFGIRSLPNLETKFVAANTLIGLDRPTGFDFRNKTIVELEQKLKDNRHKHFSAKSRKEKIDNSNEDKALRKKIAIEIINEYAIYEKSINKQIDEQNNLLNLSKNAKIRDVEKARFEKARIDIENKIKKLQFALVDKSIIDDTADKISGFDIFDTTQSAPFFESEWMFGLTDGFDIVISNPPYGAKFTESEKQYFKANYKHQDYQPESFLFFTEKSFDFLKTNAVLSFIIPNTWLTNLKLVKIRKFLTGNNLIQNISHYHKSVFDAVVDTEVVIFKKGFVANNTVKIFNHIDAGQVQELKHNQNSWKEKNGDVINIFTNPRIEKLVEKLKKSSDVLSFYCDLYSGVKPYEIGKGVPPQTKEILKNRIYDSTSKVNSSYKKVLRGSDISKFQNNWNGERWIKYGDNLAAPRKAAIFSQPKIVIRQTGDSLIATFDEEGFICLNNTHVINQKLKVDLKYILALINSTLLNFYFQYLNPETGEALAEVKKETVEKLLIKKAKDQKPFITFVDKILSAKEKNPDADTSKLEKQLDELVYKL